MFPGADLQGDGIALHHRRVLGTVIPQALATGVLSQAEEAAAPGLRGVGDERQLCGGRERGT